MRKGSNPTQLCRHGQSPLPTLLTPATSDADTGSWPSVVSQGTEESAGTCVRVRFIPAWHRILQGSNTAARRKGGRLGMDSVCGEEEGEKKEKKKKRRHLHDGRCWIFTETLHVGGVWLTNVKQNQGKQIHALLRNTFRQQHTRECDGKNRNVRMNDELKAQQIVIISAVTDYMLMVWGQMWGGS